MTTSVSRAPASHVNISQLSLLRNLRRDTALRDCRASLQTADWRIEWWAGLQHVDRAYLFTRAGLSPHHTPRDWTAIARDYQQQIIRTAQQAATAIGQRQ